MEIIYFLFEVTERIKIMYTEIYALPFFLFLDAQMDASLWKESQKI